MPYLLRNVKEQEYLEFIGEAYVHGLMHGEAMNGHERDGKALPTSVFTLR